MACSILFKLFFSSITTALIVPFIWAFNGGEVSGLLKIRETENYGQIDTDFADEPAN